MFPTKIGRRGERVLYVCRTIRCARSPLWPDGDVLPGAMGNQCRVLLHAAHTDSITGTSTRTPTTVASAAPDSGPNSAIAVATASSKKLLAPISAPGAATEYSTFSSFISPYASEALKYTWSVIGTAISTTLRKRLVMLSDWKAKIKTSVASRAVMVTGANRGSRICSNQSLPCFPINHARRVIPAAKGIAINTITEYRSTPNGTVND